MPTNYEALHLVLPQYIDPQCIAYPVVVLVRPTTGGHDAKFARSGAIECELLDLQMLHELDAIVDAVGLEADEVQATAGLHRVRLSREVDKFGQGATDLWYKEKKGSSQLFIRGCSR